MLFNVSINLINFKFNFLFMYLHFKFYIYIALKLIFFLFIKEKNLIINLFIIIIKVYTLCPIKIKFVKIIWKIKITIIFLNIFKTIIF